jgi:N-acetylglucosamine malate deacetylase 1
MFSSFKRVFILAPHTDDGELGCGGTIKKLVESGINVYYIAFSTAEESVPEGFPINQLEFEVREATKGLGIKEENLIIYKYPVRKLNYARQDILENLIELRAKYNPDLIFMPSLNDIHQDHETIAQEGLRAFKNRTLLGYELIWNNLKFNTYCFVSLEKKHIDAKVNALAKYKTQKGRAYMSKDFIYSLAKTRGVQVGIEYAETFEVVRWIVK